MGMIKLKNVSKYYYSKGIIASGITRVNLDLDSGEFVVITGESGSGKSTLLNVISGLDTYEEGEMYIEGKETSHYTASDFEEYRQKYISCIFQSFNLVSSYTVYQNVALAMQIDGREPAEIRQKVTDIIKKVGLFEFRNRKVSKLSGGQKQRVAIARALAKDTKVLVADEPTGNLDSESAEGIVDLLTDIASDKLVIVVTHNYEQFRDHATRIIKMHDGKIVEDTGAAITRSVDTSASAYGHRSSRTEHRAKKDKITYGTQLRLGLRNTFNLPAKFLLLLLVFLFVVGAVSAQYVTVKKQKDTVAEEGWNNFFANYDPKRIVVEKQDRSPFTKADYEAIKNAPHVEKLIREDVMYDSSVYIENEDFSFYGYVMDIDNLDQEPDIGGMPKADDEVVLSGYDDGWTFGENPEDLIGKTYTVTADGGYEQNVKIAGIIFFGEERTDDSEDEYSSSDFSESDYSENSMIYLSRPFIEEVRKGLYASNSKTTMLINGSEETLFVGMGGLVVNDNVPEGYILLPTSYDLMFKKGYAAGNEVRLHAKALYYDQELTLMIMGTYGEKTFEKKTGLKNLADHDGEIYINTMDYRRLYEKGNFQVSVFVDDTKNSAGMKDMLERGGYHVLVLKDHIDNFMDEEIVGIIQLPMAVIVCLAVFFIAYFVIRLILKSRGVYFATVRMLGMGKEPARRIMRVELVLDCMIAYALFVLFIYMNRIGIVKSERLMDHLAYLTVRDYVILALILLVMAVLISGRFMRSIFKSSAMGTYREEA